MQYDGTNTRDILVWILHVSGPTVITFGIEGGQLALHTIEGWRPVRPGSWVVRGVVDEFYTIEEKLFSKTYEREDQS